MAPLVGAAIWLILSCYGMFGLLDDLATGVLFLAVRFKPKIRSLLRRRAKGYLGTPSIVLTDYIGAPIFRITLDVTGLKEWFEKAHHQTLGDLRIRFGPRKSGRMGWKASGGFSLVHNWIIIENLEQDILEMIVWCKTAHEHRNLPIAHYKKDMAHTLAHELGHAIADKSNTVLWYYLLRFVLSQELWLALAGVWVLHHYSSNRLFMSHVIVVTAAVGLVRFGKDLAVFLPNKIRSRLHRMDPVEWPAERFARKYAAACEPFVKVEYLAKGYKESGS